MSLAAVFVAVSAVVYGQYRAAVGVLQVELSHQEAILQARSRDELQIRGLLTAGHLRLAHPSDGRVDEVRSRILTEIESRRGAVSKSENRDDIELAIRTLKAVAGGIVDARQVAHVMLNREPADPNRGWIVAAHPFGSSAMIAGSLRPLRVTQGLRFEATGDLDDQELNCGVWYSPSGRWVVHASVDGDLSLWNELGTEELCRWPGVCAGENRLLALVSNSPSWVPNQGGIRLLFADGRVRRLSLGEEKPTGNGMEPMIDDDREFRCTELARSPPVWRVLCGWSSSGGW